MRRNKRLIAFSLIEIVVVIGVFALIFASVTIFSLDAFRFSHINRQKATTSQILQEEINAVLLNKQDLWKSMIDSTNDGPKHIEFLDNKYEIVDGINIKEGVTLSFEVGQVFRDGLGNYTYSGGIEDINTRVLNFTATWQDPLGEEFEMENLVFIGNWNTPTWKQTLETEFNNGVPTDTIVTTTGDGAVELDLEDIINADWCLPELTRTKYNLTGLSLATAIWAIPGEVFLGTSWGWSGPAFKYITLDTENPPNITEEGEWNPADPKTRDIYGDGTYAYLATSEDAKEIIILDISSLPYQEIGYFNAVSALDANGVFVDEARDIGFMVQGDDLRAFDLSVKTGSRPELGSVQLSKDGRDIFVRGSYAYIPIKGHSRELEIVDVSDPANMQVTGYASVNSQSGTSIYVNETGDRAYLGTSLGFFQREFFIIDVSNKNGNRPIIDSYDTGITSITGLTVIGDRAIVVGWFGREYQVIDISDETDISRCGSINWNWGINDVASVTDSEENSWSYILTNDLTGEFHAILGGEQGGGGGNGQGDEYLPFGTFESEVFDTGSAATTYYSLSWDETLFQNTDLELQVRAGNSPDLSSLPWIGPDGTSSTFFTDPNGEYMPVSLNNKRYIQYFATFTSDKVNTPVLETIKINYQ